MKLSYRGVSYNHEPLAVETTASEVGGKYRGSNWKVRHLKNLSVRHPRVSLTYRGVVYHG